MSSLFNFHLSTEQIKKDCTLADKLDMFKFLMNSHQQNINIQMQYLHSMDLIEDRNY